MTITMTGDVQAAASPLAAVADIHHQGPIDLQKMSLKAGDVLVVHLPQRVPREYVDRLVAEVKKVLPAGVGCLVLDEGARLTVLEKAEEHVD